MIEANDNVDQVFKVYPNTFRGIDYLPATVDGIAESHNEQVTLFKLDNDHNGIYIDIANDLAELCSIGEYCDLRDRFVDANIQRLAAFQNIFPDGFNPLDQDDVIRANHHLFKAATDRIFTPREVIEIRKNTGIDDLLNNGWS